MHKLEPLGPEAVLPPIVTDGRDIPTKAWNDQLGHWHQLAGLSVGASHRATAALLELYVQDARRSMGRQVPSEDNPNPLNPAQAANIFAGSLLMQELIKVPGGNSAEIDMLTEASRAFGETEAKDPISVIADVGSLATQYYFEDVAASPPPRDKEAWYASGGLLVRSRTWATQDGVPCSLRLTAFALEDRTNASEGDHDRLLAEGMGLVASRAPTRTWWDPRTWRSRSG